MAATLAPILDDPTEQRVNRLLDLASEAGLRLATAESCTGGILASLFTDVPGCSHIFEAGFITYSNDAKSRMLGVDPDLLERHGAVSREVALAMARGALDRSRADIALAVTGLAGPGKPGEEAGLVHIACSRRDGLLLHRENHFGTADRGETRLRCIEVALDLLHQALCPSSRTAS